MAVRVESGCLDHRKTIRYSENFKDIFISPDVTRKSSGGG